MKRTAFALVLAAAAGLTHAQAWPSKPLRIIVPFTPGGFNDTLARTLAQELPKPLGQSVVVDNRPGGNTIIGTEAAAKSAPDGHTLFIAAVPFAVIQSLYKTPFDVTKDFQGVTQAGASGNMLVGYPGFKPNTVKELLDHLRANPGRVNYGSSGNGSSPHLSMELFKLMSKTFMVHIPYKGSAPVVTDLLAGQVDVMFDNIPNVINHVKAGKMKPYAVSSAKRSPLAPDVPTVAEAGIPGYEVSVWFGVLVPAGVPQDIVQRLNVEIVKILGTAEVRDRFSKQGVEVQTSSPEQYQAFVRAEVARWGKVIKEAGIKGD